MVNLRQRHTHGPYREGWRLQKWTKNQKEKRSRKGGRARGGRSYIRRLQDRTTGQKGARKSDSQTTQRAAAWWELVEGARRGGREKNEVDAVESWWLTLRDLRWGWVGCLVKADASAGFGLRAFRNSPSSTPIAGRLLWRLEEWPSVYLTTVGSSKALPEQGLTCTPSVPPATRSTRTTPPIYSSGCMRQLAHLTGRGTPCCLTLPPLLLSPKPAAKKSTPQGNYSTTASC